MKSIRQENNVINNEQSQLFQNFNFKTTLAFRVFSCKYSQCSLRQGKEWMKKNEKTKKSYKGIIMAYNPLIYTYLIAINNYSR